LGASQSWKELRGVGKGGWGREKLTEGKDIGNSKRIGKKKDTPQEGKGQNKEGELHRKL